jgi:DNA primase
MPEPTGQSRIVDYYTDVVLPALAERLDAAFPEFGWRRDTRGWVATNEETTHRVLGVRAERVVAHGPAPRGLLVHGGEPMLWTAYVNGGQVPRGVDFLNAVRDLAERAGVDASPLDRREPRDRRAEVLEDFFHLARREFAGEGGQAARTYLESRGLPKGALESLGFGVVPSADRLRRELVALRHELAEIEEAGLLGDRRWPGRICGAWRDEQGRIRTLWARSLDGTAHPGSKYLYLRGASRTGLLPYGLWDVLSRPFAERRDLVLVEGLLDVHQFRAREIANVVALGGTSTAPETFQRLARLGFERVTICLDRDGPGRAAAARVVERAVGARRSPAIFVVDSEHLAPSQDPDAFLARHGPDAWLELLTKRECGVTWRARELLEAATSKSTPDARREALARAGTWLGTLPARLALEQEDALRTVAETCGYSPAAAERAFRARFWTENTPTFAPTRCPDPIDVGTAL